MNLHEWKKSQTDSLREEYKDSIRQGVDAKDHFLFDQDQIAEMQEEVRIEEWSETVDFEGDLDLSESFISEDDGDLHEYFDFVPSELGEETDIELEFDLDVIDPSVDLLQKLKEKFFAEDYDIEIDEKKAKVVFNRSAGKVVKRKKCGPGMRLKGNRCIPQTGGQKAKEKRKGIKLKRAKRAMGAGKKKRAAIKARITKKRVAGKSRNFGNTVN